MIIIDKKFVLAPLVDLVKYYNFEIELVEALEAYISENTRKTIVSGEKKDVFFISGMSNKHHRELNLYLNHKVLDRYKAEGRLISGEFANFPMKHYWININGLIIDLTIKQFKDKKIDTYNKFRELLDTDCFISDNPNNIIYRLYKPDATR